MSNSPKYELNQKVFLLPEIKITNNEIVPLTIKRRTIDEFSGNVAEIQYYLGNSIHPTKESEIYATEKEVAEQLVLKLLKIVDEFNLKYGLANNKVATMVHDKPISTKSENNKIPEESEEEMRKQGYYKDQDGEWEWDRDLAVSQEYSEIIQEEVKKCKVDTAKKYYDTSELSKEESSRIKDILREFGREDLANECSDFEGIGCIIDIFVNYFREFGIAKPLDNESINNFISEMFKLSIHDGNHFYVQECVSAIAKKAIEIIKG